VSEPENTEPVVNDEFEIPEAESVEDILDLVEDDDDDEAAADSEADDFEEWEPVELDWDELKKRFDTPQLKKRQGELNALTGMFQFYWGDLNRTMEKAHQVLQADRKAQHDFKTAPEHEDVRTLLANKREEIAADEKPFDDRIAALTKHYNEQLAKLNAEKQAAVGDRITEADSLEAETVAGIKSSILEASGATDNAVGEMQDIAKNIRNLEKMPAWQVSQRKTRRNGEQYSKDVPIFSFPIPSWTKTLGKDGLGSVVAGEGGSKRVVRIDFMSLDGVEITEQAKRNFTYLRNKLGLKGSVTETTTQRLLDALAEAGMKELSTTEKFTYVQNDSKGEPHEVTVLGRPTE